MGEGVLTVRLKAIGAAVVIAFLGAFAWAAGAGELVDGSSNFLNGASPLGADLLVESRSGVGVASNEEGDRRRKRSEGQAPDRVDLTDAVAPLTRPGGPSLASGRPAALSTDFKVPPSIVSAVRGELQRLGFLK